METFIVRFYRRQARPPGDSVGTVERVGSDERMGFSSPQELLKRLLEPEQKRGRAEVTADPADAVLEPTDPACQSRRAADRRTQLEDEGGIS